MKINSVLTVKILTFLIILYLPTTQACDRNSNVEFEDLITIFNGQNDAAGDTEAYDFSTNDCGKLNYQKTNMDVSKNAMDTKLASRYQNTLRAKP